MPFRHHPHLTALTRVATAVALAATLVAACGGDDTERTLSPAGTAGRDVIRTNGCSACHGRDGGGGPGPAFTGLFGSTVELDDGTTVIADAEYLAESIREPSAKRVAGFGFPMPENDLSDAEIEQVIAYIQELADAPEETR